MGLFDSEKKPVDQSAEVTRLTQRVEGLQRDAVNVAHKHSLELERKESEHTLALKEKEFELKHFKDEEMQTLQAQLNTEKQNNAVLKKENEMLVKITDLNSDVIDVKGLVTDLIKKLPEVNITSMSIQAPAGTCR